MKALKVRQICLFYIGIMPVVKFFMMPSIVSGIAGEDLWISALINSLLDFLTVLTVYLCLKDENCDFFTLMEKRCGKVFAKTVMCFYVFFFLLKTVMPMNEEKDYVELTLYITSPTLLTYMPVFVAVIFISLKKLRAVGRIADAAVAVAISGYALMFALSVPNADFSALLPIGAHGAKNVLYGSYASQAWFNDGAYFLFFTGEYVKGKKDGLKILLSVCLSALIVVLFMIVFYGTFGSIAFRQKFALTEISKYSTAINNTERFDYFSIFALLFTSIFSLAMPFYFATELICRIVPIKRWLGACIAAAPTAFILLFAEEYFFSIETFILNIANGYFLFFGCVFPVTVSVIFKITAKKEKDFEIQRC